MPLENDIQELTGAIRALNDNIHELKQALAGGAVAPAVEDKPKPKPKPKKASKPKADQPGKDAVLEALHALQAATDSATVKSLLGSFEATTVGKLDPARYQDVIDAAQEAAA